MKAHRILPLILLLAVAVWSMTAFAPPRRTGEVMRLPDTPLVRTAASVLPASTGAFAVLDLRLLREQGISAIADLLNVERAAAIGQGERLPIVVDRLMNQFYYLYAGFQSPIPGITVNERDVMPWLGDHVIIAVIQHEAPEAYGFAATLTPHPHSTLTPTPVIAPTAYPEIMRRTDEQRLREFGRHEVVVLVQSKDDDAAGRFVESARLQTEGRYGPMDQIPVTDGALYVLPRYRTQAGNNTWVYPLGQVPGYIVLGRPRAIEGVQGARNGTQPSLAEQVGFQPPAEVPSSLFAGWGNFHALSGLLYSPFGSPVTDFSRERRLWSEILGQGALNAALLPGGRVRLHAQYKAEFPVGFPVGAAPNASPTLASLFPRNTLFLVEGRNPDSLYHFLRETLLVLTDRLDDPVNFMDGRLAAEQTIAAWEFKVSTRLNTILEPLTGSLALGMIYSPAVQLSTLNLPFSLVLIGETDTPAQASELAANLEDLILALGPAFWPQGTITLSKQAVTIGGYSFNRLTIASVANGRELVSVTCGAMNNRVLVATGDGVEQITRQNVGAESLVGSAAWQMTFDQVTDFGDLTVYYDNLKTLQFARQNLGTVDREALERASIYLEGIQTVSLILKWPDEYNIDGLLQLIATDDSDT